MRLAVVTVLVTLCSTQTWAQGVVFADGFELGHPCRWSQQEPLADCSAAEVTVYLPGDVPLTLVRIPGGTFWMGSPEGERGRGYDEDLHEVTLTQAYYLGKFEVTQAQWEAVMGTPTPTACGDEGFGPDYPVYCVSWDDICGGDTGSDCLPNSFLGRLNSYLAETTFRLPTEAEWEWAARAGTTTEFSFAVPTDWNTACGDFLEASPYMWWCNNSGGSATHVVGGKLPNAFGLYDMHGNVFEWVADWFGSYPLTAVTDPAGPETGSYRIIRGGSRVDYAETCRSAYREPTPSDGKGDPQGFRIAKTAP